jgi:hypothetical protein
VISKKSEKAFNKRLLLPFGRKRSISANIFEPFSVAYPKRRSFEIIKMKDFGRFISVLQNVSSGAHMKRREHHQRERHVIVEP